MTYLVDKYPWSQFHQEGRTTTVEKGKHRKVSLYLPGGLLALLRSLPFSSKESITTEEYGLNAADCA